MDTDGTSKWDGFVTVLLFYFSQVPIFILQKFLFKFSFYKCICFKLHNSVILFTLTSLFENLILFWEMIFFSPLVLNCNLKLKESTVEVTCSMLVFRIACVALNVRIRWLMLTQSSTSQGTNKMSLWFFTHRESYYFRIFFPSANVPKGCFSRSFNLF